MIFTTAHFHDLIDSDIWVLEQIRTMPSDPDPVITTSGKKMQVEMVDTVAISQMEEATKDYRRHLLPAIFVMAQKVYAELFRVVLGSTGHAAGERQFDVEQALHPLLSACSVCNWHPFDDRNHFSLWWAGPRYDFTRLQHARNVIMHGKYTFANARLFVRAKDGSTLLDWTEQDILEFSDEVLKLGKST